MSCIYLFIFINIYIEINNAISFYEIIQPVKLNHVSQYGDYRLEMAISSVKLHT